LSHPSSPWTRVLIRILAPPIGHRPAGERLVVLPTDVVDVREETLHRGESSELAVGSAVIVGMDVGRESDRAGAIVHVRPRVGPLAQQDADEGFDLAVPLVRVAWLAYVIDPLGALDRSPAA